MRLFVALDVPRSITAALAEAGIAPSPGVRLVPPAQMHITLHFIGDARASDLRLALARVRSSPCRLTVERVGRFEVGGGRRILWAGVTATAELLELHAACGRALAATGYELERRRFVPHVTLARLAPSVDVSVVKRFVSACAEKRFGDFLAREFVLYDSVAAEDRIRYEVIEAFPLT